MVILYIIYYIVIYKFFITILIFFGNSYWFLYKISEIVTLFEFDIRYFFVIIIFIVLKLLQLKFQKYITDKNWNLFLKIFLKKIIYLIIFQKKWII